MRQVLDHLFLTTAGQRLYEITERVRSWVAAQAIQRGCSPCSCIIPRPRS